MQRVGNQFLAGAGLAEYANARLGGSHAVHLRHHFLHGVASPDDLVPAKPLPQLTIFRLEALQP